MPPYEKNSLRYYTIFCYNAYKQRGKVFMDSKKRSGILYQIYVIAVIGLIMIGMATFLSQREISQESVIDHVSGLIDEVAEETSDSISEYPGYKWLLQYWYTHADELDIEYDVDYRPGTKTEEKTRLLAERHPDFQPRYAGVEDIEQLPPEDQKLYAEIIYSWMTTRLNQMKHNYKLSYLFCLATPTTEGKGAYESQFFLLSGADPGAVRGTEYEQVYPLGKVSSIKKNKSMQNAMREAFENKESDTSQVYMAEAGAYVDYYAYVCEFDDQAVLIGLTYDLSEIIKDVNDSTVQGTSFAVMYQVVLLIILMLMLYFAVIRPLREVQANIRLYARKKERSSIAEGLAGVLAGLRGFLTRRNEIGLLAEDVSELAYEMDDYIDRIETITAEKERIGVELELASRIQRNALPDSPPEREEFDLAASMSPAREVGGDFYDYFMIDEDHLAIVIADVSGKGVPAALFMISSMMTVRNIAMNHYSPAQTLEAVNNEICENNDEEMFVTAWLGVLEISTGILTAANAGHEYPILRAADGNFRLFRDVHGLVIGCLEDQQYQEYTIRMEPGAKLFVYTDGLTEATDAEKAMFGNARVLRALSRCQDDSPKMVLNSVSEAVTEFVGEAEQFDDLTMLCIEYKGRKDQKK